MSVERYIRIDIVPIGDISIGKTSLSNVFHHENMSPAFNPCMGVDFIIKKITIDGKFVKVLIWETHGQERHGRLHPYLYQRADGIMLVYDITNRQSFDNLKEHWYKEICQQTQHSDKQIECILVGNKCDLESERAVDVSTGKEFADSLNIPFIETSAMENINVDTAFVLLTVAVLKKLPITESNDNVVLIKRNIESKSRCFC